MENRGGKTMRNCEHLHEIVPIIHTPGAKRVIGLTGQAGAGKTKNRAEIEHACEERAIPFLEVSLDWFFIKSSEDRAKWLAEAKDDPTEYARRADQSTWWDFQKAADVITDLKEGRGVKLEGVYNRADKGRLTKNIDLPATNDGGIILIEGVAVCDLPLDVLIFIAECGPNRFRRLCRRDYKRRPTLADALERFNLTEEFERSYFNEERWKRVQLVVDGSDNGGTRILPKLPRQKLVGFIQDLHDVYFSNGNMM